MAGSGTRASPATSALPPGPPPYAPAFLAAQEQRLRREREELLRQLALFARGSVAPPSLDSCPPPSDGYAGPHEEPVPDGPIVLGPEQLSSDFGQLARDLLAEIDDALARLAQGTYGWDERRQVWLREDRLRAVPWARHELGWPAGERSRQSSGRRWSLAVERLESWLMGRKRGWSYLLAIAGAVLLADQLTKQLVVRWLPAGASWPTAGQPLGRYFSVTHVENTGVAFGLLQGHSEWLALIAIVVVLTLLFYRHRQPSAERLLDTAIGLQVGGACGNLIDRLTVGHVIDFIDFKFWPVFNLADMAISGGVLLLAWRLWREERSPSPQVDAEPGT